ncbi:MAG TPA: prolyl oligopeptidase family serine peptidase [Labilithrix sp.]
MKPRSLFILVACACLISASCGPAAPPAPPPMPTPPAPQPERAAVKETHGFRGPAPAARRPVVHEYFGTKVTDDYEWLEDGASAEVKAFTDAQSAFTRTLLDALPERAAVRARFEQLLGASSPNYMTLRSAGGTLFVFVDKPPKQQPLLVTRNAAGDAASEKTVVDPNAIDPSGKTTIDFFVPSPDGKLVAVSLSKDGTESGDLHVFDVASGKEKGDVLTRVNGGTAGGSVAWNESGTGFFYTRYPHAGERPEADLDFFQQVFFHELGKKEADDKYAFGKDLPRIAEIELARSDDGKAILASVANGDGGEFEHHVFAGGTWKRLTKLSDEVVVARFGADGKIYAVSRKGAPRGKVIAFAPPFSAPTDVLGEGDAVIDDVVATKSGLYLVEIAGGPSRMRRVPIGIHAEPLAREPEKDKKPKKKDEPPKKPATTIAPGARGVPAAEIPLLAVSNVSEVERAGEDLFIRNESYTEPPAWYRYRASEHRTQKTSMAKAAPADMSDVEVVRETCASKDGTRVPMTILRKKGTKLDGSNAAVLTGYGGFGVSIKPVSRAWERVVLDAGGVVADTNLRGGGELGEEWHRAGRLANKQNVFDDFSACAKALVDLGYTKPERLGIMGRSNGGLLMGASLVQHPEQFRAVVSAVGIYDMLRTELSPNGAFNVTEYGTVKEEPLFRALFGYSPLHNVKDAVAYPSVLFVTGANDPRVDPYHSRKMLARLQAATSSEHPILLRASADTGHGMGTPLGAEIDEYADELAFLFHELGITPAGR